MTRRGRVATVAVVLALAMALVSASGSALEIPPDDFPISTTGPDGSTSYAALGASVAYNRQANEYLAVWLVDAFPVSESYVAGRRIDAATGALIGGADFRISGDHASGETGVVWNPVADEYLVVWENTATDHIHGQRVTAAGTEVGADDFQISTTPVTTQPDLAYNRLDNEYLVVWRTEVTGSNWEILARRVSGAGAAVGAEIRASQMGADGVPGFSAFQPTVAHNTTANEYLVVWSGNEAFGHRSLRESEIYGRRLTAAGATAGAQIRISDMGNDGFDVYGTNSPAVAYSPDADEYLVVWQGTDGESAWSDYDPDAPIPDGTINGVVAPFVLFSTDVVSNVELDVKVNHTWVGDLAIYIDHAALLVAALDQPGVPASIYGCPEDNLLVLLTDDAFNTAEDTCFPSPPGSAAINGSFLPNEPLSTFNGTPAGGLWEVRVADVEPGEFGSVDEIELRVNRDREIFGQRLTGAGVEVGANDFEVGTPAGADVFSASHPAVAYNPSAQEYLVTWGREDEADGRFEIAAKRLALDGSTLEDLGLISMMGPTTGPGDWEGQTPAVAYNSIGNEYLVVWRGADDILGRADEEQEIYGQRLGGGARVPFDVGLQDPTQGRWHLRDSGTAAVTTFYFGNPGDVPFTGDWDCDGDDTPGLYRQSDGFVYLRNSNTEGVADIEFFFGDPGDLPIIGDFNGNGCDTVSIYRESEQRFYIVNALGEDGGGLGAAEFSFLFGNPGDAPTSGDWDGDGITEAGLYRESTGFFYSRNSLTTGVADDDFFFGDPGDKFVGGDWGIVDGRDTPAVFRGSVATFFFKHTLTEGIADSSIVFGESGWNPLAGRFGL